MTLKHIAITGAAGNIGRRLVKELEDKYELVLLDTRSGPHNESVRHVDVSDAKSFYDAVCSCDAIVHLAATGVDAPPDVTCKVNVTGTWNALAIAQALNIRKVITMSSEAGLGMEYMDIDPPPLYVPIDERHPFRPSDAYGVSKQIVEALGRQFARQGPGLSVVCLRPTEVMFPHVAKHVSELLSREVTEGTRALTRTFQNPEGLAISRAYVRADDMVRMIRLALEVETEPFEVFWASADDCYGDRGTLDNLSVLFGHLPEVRRPVLYRANATAAVFDTSLARARLGWEPTRGGWQAALTDLATGHD